MVLNKIAFTGPFGDTNFGDYAMLVNNIYDIDCKNIVLLTHDRNFSKIVTEAYLQDYQLEIVDVDLKEFENKDGYAYTPIEIIDLVNNTAVIVASLRDVDVLVVNGGGYFNGYWAKPPRMQKLMKMVATILLANQLNKKIVFTGNSLGPFGDEQDFFTNIFASLNHTYFAARDDLYSKTWFKQLGIDAEVTFIPDDLLFVNNKINQRPTCLEVKSNQYVILDTFESTDYIKCHLGAFKKFVNTMREEHHLSVVYLPLNVADDGVDQGELLKTEIPEIELVDISQIGYLPIEDAIKIISRAKLVVSSRYHALVISLANQVPIINALGERMADKRYYYNKNSGLIRQVFQDLELDENYLLKTDFADSLDFVVNNFDVMVAYQNQLFHSPQYQENKVKLQERRKYHFEKIN